MIEYKVVIDHNGDERWYLNDKLHCEHGPACTKKDGSKFWYKNNELHRENGPAVIYADGTQIYYVNGKKHRTDGPAAIYSNGSVGYWLNGEVVSEEDVIGKKVYTAEDIQKMKVSDLLYILNK